MFLTLSGNEKEKKVKKKMNTRSVPDQIMVVFPICGEKKT